MMRLMSLKQYMSMSKPALIRKIMKTLRAMPKKKLALACYNLTKAKLPALKVIKRKALPKRKTKRKFSPKQLAAQRLFAKRSRAGTLLNWRTGKWVRPTRKRRRR